MILLLVINLNLSFLSGQEKYQVFYVNNYNKLPTNFVKSITQDSLGFIWLATDNGLVNFDGENNKIYTDPYNSKYFKSLYNKNNALFVLSDDGISQLNYSNGKPKLVPFIQGSEKRVDSKVFYPKELYIDKNNIIWISEPTSIIKLDRGTFRRYEFTYEDFTQSYTRSFSFLEDKNGKLIIASERGNIFYYNEKSDSIIKIPVKDKFDSSIDAFIINDKNEIVAGGSSGLFEITINDEYSTASYKKLSDLVNISAIRQDRSGEYYIGSWTKGLYYTSDLSHPLQKLTDLKYDIVINIYIAGDQTIWISSDEGAAFLKKIKFLHTTLTNDAFYIQSVVKTKNNTIITTDGNSVVEIIVKDNSFHKRNLFNRSSSLIRSICGNPDDLWIGFSDGFVIHKTEKSSHSINISYEISGENVLFLSEEDNNSIWGVIGYSRGIFTLNKNYSVRFDSSLKKLTRRINVIKKSKNNILYIGCSGKNSYLFRYDDVSEKFINISKPIKNFPDKELEVIDIGFDDYGNIWLATNAGLLKYSNNEIQYINEINFLINSSLNSLAVDSSNNVWLGSDNGFIYYETNGNYAFFNENAGIPNATSSIRGAVVDGYNRVVFGTAKGLIYQRKAIGELEKTNRPVLFLQKKDTILLQEGNSFTIRYGEALHILFNSFTFPTENSLYQYRIVNLDSNWSVPNDKKELTLLDLDYGNYVIEFRAIEQGKAWSNITTLHFTVEKPFYLSYIALTLFVGFIFGAGYVSVKYLQTRNEKNKLKQQLNHFFKVSNNILFITDTEWRLIFVNPYGIEFFHFSGDYSEKRFPEIFPEKNRKEIIEKLKDISVNNNLAFISEIEDHLGRKHFYQFNIIKSSELKMFFINASDVSEIKNLEFRLQDNIKELERIKAGLEEKSNELKRSQEELEKLNADKDKFFSIIAHDLKGPFFGLLNLSEMMIEDYHSNSSESIIDNLVRLNSLIQKTYHLTKNLLEWSQLQIKAKSFSPEKVHINDAVTSVIRDLEQNIKAKKINLNFAPEKNYTVLVDRTMLNSILTNLINNALKFTEPGGTVTISSKELNNGFLEILVKDDGIGIPEQIKDKLFKISEKAGRKGTMGEESTGLGLILCKEFVEKNGGVIRFESEVGKGTTFYFTVPLVEE